jgi:biotin transport system permease protein/energy-coupling factor transport system permease protein
MKEKNVIFRYRKGNSVLHRLPALLKLFLLLSLGVGVMFLPLYAISAGIVMLMIPAFLCGFTVREQLTDIKPALFYALFLYMISIFTGLFSADFNAAKSADIAEILYPDYEYGLYILRLLLVMQLSALLFRTTTSIEIKEAVCAAETTIRGTIKKLPFAKNISMRAKLGTGAALTINFIPALFELWNSLNRAWKARGGKGGLKKARILLIALIALSFHYALEKARALAARELV